MIEALDKMILPALVDSAEPSDLEAFRNKTLTLFLSLLAKYPVKGFENVKNKSINPQKLIGFAKDVADTAGLSSKDSYMAFNKNYTENGQQAKQNLMSVEKKLSKADKFLYGAKFIDFMEIRSNFNRDNKALIEASGYKSGTALENGVAGILAFLVQNYGDSKAAGVSTALDTPSADTSSAGSEGTGASKKGAASKKAVDEKASSWVLPAVAVGCVAIGFLVFSQVKAKPRKRKSSYAQNERY
jgi:hypothetical protein